MKHFRFDSNGIYETENPRLIKLLSRKFETAEETIKEPEHETENKVFKCKKCNFETDNQGILMRHYKDHKKEE